MRIAIIGLRDIPAKYGGVETAVEEIGSRLAASGNEVSAYCMAGLGGERPSHYKGVKRIEVPTIQSKNFAMVIYSFLATCHAIFGRYDVIHLHAIGPGALSFLCWLVRQPVIVTCHGVDYKRQKWGFLARAYLRFGAYASARFADEVISVSRSLQAHYRELYGREVNYIPNGSTIRQAIDLGPLGQRYGIKKHKYIVFVGRLVECKRIDLLIRSFSLIESEFKLVIVGDGPDKIVTELKAIAGASAKIVLTGPLYDEALAAVFSNAGLFVLPSVLEGLPIALIEALSYDLPVVVSDIAENMEVIEGADPSQAIVTRADDQESLLQGLLKGIVVAETLRHHVKGNAEFVAKKYNWDDVARQTEAVYRAAAKR